MSGKIDGATRAKLLKELDTHDDAKLHAALESRHSDLSSKAITHLSRFSRCWFAFGLQRTQEVFSFLIEGLLHRHDISGCLHSFFVAPQARPRPMETCGVAKVKSEGARKRFIAELHAKRNLEQLKASGEH